MSAPQTTETRKVEHININLEKDVRFVDLTTGLENYRFVHQALPEMDLHTIDMTLSFFGKELSAPILISSMTGGAEVAYRINRHLAEAAQKHRIGLGLGSQRAAIEDSSLAYSYQVRQFAPDILLLANLGAVQLNYGYGLDECQKAVEMVEANALILHFNVLQEAVQPEGNTNFHELLKKVETICSRLEVPVIAKEVGWGFSERNIRYLRDAGVSAIDVAGSGGTSWSKVEYYRAPNAFHANVAAAFNNWGIPTSEAIQYATSVDMTMPVIASGGLRDGVDIAKCIALGARFGGIAGPFLHAANESAEAVDELIRILKKQLQVAMFCTASSDLESLAKAELVKK